MSNEHKRWTEEEEKRLLQQVSTFPQNLNNCFLIVSEVIGRSPKAVAAHWYAVTSKKPNATCFFTASSKHVAKNRKNSKGVPCKKSVWRRLLSIIRNL